MQAQSLSVYQWGLVAIATVYAFAFGATLGSFANVVVYRMPRGRNVIYPGSRCPVCESPIRGRDNIPVLSWLLLRGRCRNCRSEISPRYFYVELFLGCLFVFLLWADVLSGGAYLPTSTTRTATYGLSEVTLANIDWTLIGMAVFHGLLMFFLVCFALIEWDGHLVPGRLLATVWTVGLVIGFLLPEMRSLNAFGEVRSIADHSWYSGLADGFLGALAGLAAGAVFWACSPTRRFSAWNLASGWSCAGIYLGWQAIAPVALLAGLSLPILACVAMALRNSTAANLLAAEIIGTALHLLTWQSFSGLRYWPSHTTPISLHMGSIFIVAILSGAVIRCIPPIPPRTR